MVIVGASSVFQALGRVVGMLLQPTEKLLIQMMRFKLYSSSDFLILGIKTADQNPLFLLKNMLERAIEIPVGRLKTWLLVVRALAHHYVVTIDFSALAAAFLFSATFLSNRGCMGDSCFLCAR